MAIEAIAQGETALITIAVVNENGDAVHLAGYEIRVEIDTPTRIVKDSDDGDVTVPAAPGDTEFSFTLDPADTSGLTILGARKFAVEARIRSPGGAIYRVLSDMLPITEALFTEMDPTDGSA